MRHSGTIFGALLLISAGASGAPQYPGADSMTVPQDYRDWVFLTSSLDLSYLTTVDPSQHLLDNVFADPKSYQAFLATGAWPDGTVLVKENRFAESAGTLSKRGRFQGAIKDLEIHVKDGARFPGGWAFFKSSDGKEVARLKPPGADCYSCHSQHGAVDTTFVQFYPTLLPIAQAKGTLSASYLKDSTAK